MSRDQDTIDTSVEYDRHRTVHRSDATDEEDSFAQFLSPVDDPSEVEVSAPVISVASSDTWNTYASVNQSLQHRTRYHP